MAKPKTKRILADNLEAAPFRHWQYEFLGKVYELSDFTTPSDESVQRLQAIIDEAFGRSKKD